MPLQRAYHSVLLVLLVMGLARTAFSQDLPQDRRFLFGGNIGIRTTVNQRTDRANFMLFAETGRFAATQKLGPAMVYDVSFSSRLWRQFSVGTNVSYASMTSTTSIEAQVPHPFFFEFPRTARSQITGLQHGELAVHLQGQFRVPLGNRLSLMVFAGPTIFKGRQDLIATIKTTENGFPFDKVNIVSHNSQTVTVTGLGYNVGFDFTYFGFLGRSEILDRFGASLMYRFSRATPSVRFAQEYQPGLELGGTHILGGLRIAF